MATESTKARFHESAIGDAVLRALVSAFFLAAALHPGFDPFLRDDPDPRTGPAVLLSLLVALIYGVLAVKGFYRTLAKAV